MRRSGGHDDEGESGALVATGVRKAFAGTVALDGVSLRLEPGTTVGLIGPNGSGKTTLINCVSGIVRPDDGTVVVGGVDLARRPAHARAGAGVARTFQNIRLFRDLTVAQNCEVALVARPGGRRGARSPLPVAEVLGLLGLDSAAHVRASALSYGAQRRAELARAAVTAPRFLLLDEPAAGMNEAETEELIGSIGALRERLRLRRARRRARPRPDRRALRRGRGARRRPLHQPRDPAGGAGRPGGDRGVHRRRGGGEPPDDPGADPTDRGGLAVKRTLIALLGAGALSFTVAACGSSDEGSGSGSTSASSGGAATTGGGGGDTVKVGYAAALSGFLAPYDTPFYNALKLAVADQNARGGLAGRYRIELDVKDVKSEIPVAAQVAQELVDDGSQILITPCDADPSVAAGQPAQTAQIPAISGCAGSPRLPSSVGDYMFQNVFAINSQVVPLAEYAIRDRGLRSAFLLYSPDTRYTNDGPLHFGEVFERLGGSIVGRETYKFQGQEFGAQIAKIRAARPDLIMTSAYDPDLSAFLKQLRAAGVDAPVYGTDGADAPSLLRSAGASADGLVFATHGMPVREEPAVEAFAAEYREDRQRARERVRLRRP